jgi:transposase-like protein
VCPKSSCGAKGTAVAKIGGVKHSHRDGLYRCKTCRGQFTVTVGTIFERSKVPLQDWLRAIHMLSSNKLGPHVTIREMELELDVTYKTSFQMWKRICGVLSIYKGHNKGFGKKVEAFITSKRPKSTEGITNWREKSKVLLNGGDGVPKISGVLSSSAREGSENLDRTERLLRLLIAATPRLSKSAKRKAARRKRSQLKGGIVSASAS